MVQTSVIVIDYQVLPTSATDIYYKIGVLYLFKPYNVYGVNDSMNEPILKIIMMLEKIVVAIR